MAPTSLILIQHTIMKPTASHFIDGAEIIGHFVLLGLVPGVVVGGGVVEFVEADCLAPAGNDAGGLVCLAGVVPGIFEGCVGGHGRQDRRCWLRVS